MIFDISLSMFVAIYLFGAVAIICDGRLFDACIPVYRISPATATTLFFIFTIIWPVTAGMLLARKPRKSIGYYTTLMDYARTNMNIDDQIAAHQLFVDRQWEDFERYVDAHKLKMKAQG